MPAPDPTHGDAATPPEPPDARVGGPVTAAPAKPADVRAEDPAVVAIAIDARAAVRPELGGVERYTRELCARLPALRPGAYRVLAPRPRLVHRAGHAWEQLVLPVRAARAPLLLCPANVAPLAHPRVVAVLHDAAPLRHPGWYSPAFARLMAVLLPAVARRALHVVTVSEFSRRELAELTGVDPAKISVVPGGVDADVFARAKPARRGRPYVLCVASHTARKNLSALVPAADALAAQGIELLVAGGHRPQFAQEPDLGAVRLLGPVPDTELPGLYAGAELFVLPSLHEGFGLPVLEAMAAGTPVVTTASGALPQTSGGAARLTEPEPEALRHAILELLGDGTERARLAAAGRERVRACSWDATARYFDALMAALRNGANAGADLIDPSGWSRRSPE